MTDAMMRKSHRFTSSPTLKILYHVCEYYKDIIFKVSKKNINFKENKKPISAIWAFNILAN
jgi:hypothetical protein